MVAVMTARSAPGHHPVGWLLLLLLATSLLGCPPSREDSGDGQASSTALLLSVYYPSFQASAATVLIPREAGMDCELPGYGLTDDDEDFLSVSLVRGDLFEWPGSYAPNGVGEDCSSSGYYYYNFEDQRCLVGVSGLNSEGETVALNEDAVVRITSYSATQVSGSVQTSPSQIEYFSATNCGERAQYGYPDGSVPAPGREGAASPWSLRFR